MHFTHRIGSEASWRSEYKEKIGNFIDLRFCTNPATLTRRYKWHKAKFAA